MDVVCSGTVDCYDSSSSGSGRRKTTVYGTLSPSSGSSAKAYGTATGWDFSTGIGTVNAYNLVQNWGTVSAGKAGVKPLK